MALLIALAITSPTFAHSGPIDAHYTCEGADTSPEPQWAGEPRRTSSFVVMVDDPDQRLEVRRLRWALPADRNPSLFFKLYALDTALPDVGRPTKTQLLDAMKGHVLAEAQLIGTYKKKHP